MKFVRAYTALASVATIASAASCTSDNALAWPYTPDDGTTCNGDEHCEAIVAEGQCNSLSLIDDEDTTKSKKLAPTGDVKHFFKPLPHTPNGPKARSRCVACT